MICELNAVRKRKERIDMKRVMRKRAVGALLLATLAGSAIAVAGATGKPNGSPHRATAATSALRQVAPGGLPTVVLTQGGDLDQGFAVLTQPVTVPLPTSIAQGFVSPASLGIDPSQARYVASVGTWVIPGSNGVCLLSVSVAGTGVGSSVCGSTSQAMAGDVVAVTDTPAGAVITTGLAPNGVSSMSVTDADGATATGGVTDNVFQVSGGQPVTLTPTTAAGPGTPIEAVGRRTAAQ